ncbi:selenocysteine insertion sequence-binding protein 2 [Austrofundulus limnaeus]|uniref:Selenocysteine insertion sequence-binding protein 2 n=1 Tax=Austrofundulus limnaeus TaxID=52670 RepID=A0A2I4CI62_AUSLI|nr:PREDICTED: selenocysteine insertion sequence-binding protein 2 [Austrofundulus limnaeus]
MDMESKLTSTASATDHKYYMRQRREAVDPHTDSTPLILPNPYESKPALTRNWSGFSPKPSGKGGDGSRSHGYSSHRPVASKRGNDSQGRNSVNAQKKGSEGIRSAPNPARKSAQANFVPFEVKMADFPALAGDSLSKTAHPAAQTEHRGRSYQTTSPQTLATSWKSGSRGSAAQVDTLQNATDAKVTTPFNSTGQPVVTSWANIASQPPKIQPVVPDGTVGGAVMQAEDLAAANENGAAGKKKRRKKKKTKSSGEGAEAESEDPIKPQEPPKFEDEEEFPGLAVALTGSNRFIPSSKTKLCSEENQRDVGQHHLVEQNKEKFSSGKTQPTEAAKKEQKAEKVSGKKSKAPVQLDIGNVLAALEKKQQSQKSKQDTKPVVLSVGGGLPVFQKQPSALKKPHKQQDKIAHNPLDSTSPLVKKGKQRVNPKAKKPTPLKKVILKEREERKQKRLLEERGLLPENESKLADGAEEEQNAAAADDSFAPGFDDDEDDAQLCVTNSVVEEEEEEKEDGDEETDKDESVQPEVTSAELQQAPVPKIHSRKFRDYCSQVLSKDLDECVTSLLKELVRFQDRLYQKDPMKARMKRRIVMGLREVLKHLKLKKVKCVIISPNCERIQSKGGLDEALHTIISMCREQSVPFVFALSRKALGHCVNKAVPVSLVGIFNYDGAQDYYHRMIELSSEASRAYEVKLSSLERTDPEEDPSSESPPPLNDFAEDPNPGPDEPEYMKFWKKVLEKDSSCTLFNFEEQLRSLHLDSECTENTEQEES